MFDPLNYPFLVLVVPLIAFWFAAWIGDLLRAKYRDQDEESRRDFLFIIDGTLTLLGLLIGSFSMAVNRYDQRRKLRGPGSERHRSGIHPGRFVACG
jgi:hypothetical protein